MALAFGSSCTPPQRITSKLADVIAKYHPVWVNTQFNHFHCHFVKGVSHFRTPLWKGTEIIRKMQGFTTGLAIPRYVVSTRIGKIPLDPNYIVDKRKKTWTLLNYEGRKVEIPCQ